MGMGEKQKNSPGVGAPGEQTVLDGFEPRTLDHIHSTTETLLISSLLNQGQRYAIKMPELMRITGLDSRTIRMRIHAERQNKIPIMEFDDLYNCGYIALRSAVAHFENKAQTKFLGYYLCYLAGTVFVENGLSRGGHYEDGRRRFDPVITRATLRLDAPTNTNQEKPEPLVNVLGNEQFADPATDTIEQIEEQVYQQQLHDALEGLIDDLPELQQYVIRQKYYSGQDCARIADMLECNRSRVHSLEDQALLQLRKAGRSVGLDKFLNTDMDYYSGTGVGAFKHTGSSSTERLAQRRMDMEARFARLL